MYKEIRVSVEKTFWLVYIGKKFDAGWGVWQEDPLIFILVIIRLTVVNQPFTGLFSSVVILLTRMIFFLW